MSEGIDSKHIPIFESHTRPVRRAGVHGFITAMAVMVALSGCGESNNGDESTKVNAPYTCRSASSPAPSRRSNGSIHVDDNAAVTSATTVNGSVHLGDHATRRR